MLIEASPHSCKAIVFSTNMLQFFKALFGIIGVKYTGRYLSKLVSVTPYINSMFGICAVLSKYNVSNNCVRITDKEDIMELEDYGIVLYKERFVIVCPHTADNEINIIRASGERMTIQKEKFLENWNGTIILVKRRENSGEPDLELNLRQKKLTILKTVLATVCTIILIFLGIAYNQHVAIWQWWTIMVVNILGCGVSFILLQKQLHIPNRFADRLCSLTKESRCEKVTDSKGATVFGIAKLSEIGMAFFFANLLLLLSAPAALHSLALWAIFVLPFTFWSIWYQKYKAKSWCVLCLITLALMWLQVVPYLLGGFYGSINRTDFGYFVAIAALYGIFTLGVNRLMEILEKYRSSDVWHMKYNELRMRDEVVEAIESTAPVFDTDSSSCSDMIFGNPDAKHQITVFSNPYCGHCTDMHEHIKDLPGEDVCVRYVMTTFNDELSDINKYLIAAYQQLGAQKAWGLMTEWYAGGNGKNAHFFESLGLDINTKAVNEEFEKQMKWRTNDKLTGTPTVIVNGREVVEPYTVDDYMFLPK